MRQMANPGIGSMKWLRVLLLPLDGTLFLCGLLRGILLITSHVRLPLGSSCSVSFRE